MKEGDGGARTVAKRMTGSTRLQHVLQAVGLKPMHVVREAQRLAAELGRPALSRQHFARIRSGRAATSEDKIYIIVAAMRSVTGLLFRPSDLFDIEPVPQADLAYGRSVSVPVSSERRTPRVWRLFVPQDSDSTEVAFESLYTEYGYLLRTIAIRRYHIPADDAEALVHDIFAAYLQRHTHVRDVRGWLLGAIANASSNYLRKRKPEAALLPEHEEAADIAAEDSLDTSMRRLTIASVLAKLGDKCRETLRRYYLHDEPKERIAAELDTSPAYVLQLLVSCRRRAQEILRNLSGRKE